MGRGTGLRLATVYGIVKQHEGFINVYSEPGQGTTFHIYFPASSGVAEPTRVPSVTRPSKGNETILVADDHEGLRELAEEFLTRDGYTVILAKDGQEAVQLFRENPGRVDLVMLDVVMPLLRGPERAGRLRSNARD